ncbi:hypothetical protein VFPPC_18749 [Pochonia chlamydosporia 170]|uniref:Uncharacterized protein n=1 Tax=Pochonia chlamydosporia 170 TaxID=1380566 RepID=A0A219ATB1_METCM|nr:hypothetical protein VFPPC_18749 [Pochonia chlamydosporia 170]OWT43524.1 hypothetical protein VFPPC_18749 [Pochonia chlamydosporia 170]
MSNPAQQGEASRFDPGHPVPRRADSMPRRVFGDEAHVEAVPGAFPLIERKVLCLVLYCTVLYVDVLTYTLKACVPRYHQGQVQFQSGLKCGWHWCSPDAPPPRSI